MTGEQNEGGDRRGWTDPRYADIVARIDKARRWTPRRDGPPVVRGFVYDLPPDRRPPTVD
ncbi:hypothetical protein [Streptomyces sp. SBT349]|uniref:hypothetical protein n=1 Tax=Streptomyces sp. SBT349 TaxID=1580539 RepID=UPI00066C2AB4|nr:hypothetical protein [Streptomyces sp. SBT349]